MDNSSRNISVDETKTSLNEEVNRALEDYERIDIDYPNESDEKIARLKEIKDKLHRNLSEGGAVEEVIAEIDNKLKIEQNFYDQEKEVNKLAEENKRAEPVQYAHFNKYEDEEEGDYPRMTKKFFDKLLCSNFRLYYRTYELNDVLYLHFKGFKRIENLDMFKNVKVLYLEGNAIRKIEGLQTLSQLSSLYLHENVIHKIEGLDGLQNLYNLNLSDNCITAIENLENLPNLSNLLLKRNRIGLNGLQDLEGLKGLSSTVTVLEISENRIDEANGLIDDYLVSVKNLRVLYLQGNDCMRKVPHYRKHMINSLKELRYLDDRPVFEDERRFSEAFARGGLEEERNERRKCKKEKEEAELKRIEDFREMVSKWRGDKENQNRQNESKEEKEKETDEDKEAERRKLLLKCKSKADNKIKIKEETIDEEGSQPDEKHKEIFDDEKVEEMPSLEKVKITEHTEQSLPGAEEKFDELD